MRDQPTPHACHAPRGCVVWGRRAEASAQPVRVHIGPQCHVCQSHQELPQVLGQGHNCVACGSEVFAAPVLGALQGSSRGFISPGAGGERGHGALGVFFSCSVVSDSLQPYGLQHARLLYPSPSLRACSNSCPLSWWCHPTIWSLGTPFFGFGLGLT